MKPVLTIDVEDWFQVENLRSMVSRESWELQPRRVEENTDKILTILDETGTCGTFFCLGWIAERHRGLIRRIQAAGHEIASHGYHHRLIYEQTIEDFRDDVLHSRKLLEDITGEAITGYRAPSFSITAEALTVLAEAGYRYDSSWFPAQMHDRYGKVEMTSLVDWSRTSRAGAGGAHISLRCGLEELAITTLQFGRWTLPWAGGGYFRLYPPGLFLKGFSRAIRHADGGCFYLHPWEVDPGQPRVSGLTRSHAFRHYVNLNRTADRLRTLCSTFSFDRADRALGITTGPHRHT